jgi:hypothetical protein
VGRGLMRPSPDRAKGEPSGPEIVSRPTQAGPGLFTALVVYSAAPWRPVRPLVFAFVYGRVGRLGPRTTAALLALAGLVSISFPI